MCILVLLIIAKVYDEIQVQAMEPKLSFINYS